MMISNEHEEIIEKLYWEFDSETKKGSFSERDIFKFKMRYFVNQYFDDDENVAIKKDGAGFYNPEQAYYQAEEHECAMMALDDAFVPRSDKAGKLYSLVGRVQWAIGNSKSLSWWKKDKDGWPIETWDNRPFSSLVRIIFQNIRKITGLKMKLSIQMMLFEFLPSVACLVLMLGGKTELAMLSGLFATICSNHRKTEAAIARLSALQESNAAGNSTAE